MCLQVIHTLITMKPNLASGIRTKYLFNNVYYQFTDTGGIENNYSENEGDSNEPYKLILTCKEGDCISFNGFLSKLKIVILTNY